MVFFAVWLYRANGNRRAFNAWARLGHLVEGRWTAFSFRLSIWYRAVREVWQKSMPPDEVFLSAPGPPAVFPTWWLFWLLASFSGNISMRLSFNENVSLSTSTIVSIVASVLFILAAVFAYFVVDAMDKKQEETFGKLRLGKFAGLHYSPSRPIDVGCVSPDA